MKITRHSLQWMDMDDDFLCVKTNFCLLFEDSRNPKSLSQYEYRASTLKRVAKEIEEKCKLFKVSESYLEQHDSENIEFIYKRYGIHRLS